jgi:insulin receptor
MVDDVNDFSSTDEVSYPMTKLDPFTQYAYYVKAYMLSTEKTGAQSNIDYFRTLPGQPSVVSKLQVIESTNSSVVSHIAFCSEFQVTESQHFRIFS